MDIKTWPAQKVQMRPLSGLIPYAQNARVHTEEQVAQLVASIEEWGWTIPILVDEANEIIAGHGRVLAAQQLDIDKVPIMVARGWTDAQKRAYRLADNQLALNASWDDALITREVAELFEGGFDVALAGFDPPEAPKLQDFDSGDRLDVVGDGDGDGEVCPACGRAL